MVAELYTPFTFQNVKEYIENLVYLRYFGNTIE